MLIERSHWNLMFGAVLAMAVHWAAAAAYVVVSQQANVRLVEIQNIAAQYEVDEPLAPVLRLTNHGALAAEPSKVNWFIGTDQKPRLTPMGASDLAALEGHQTLEAPLTPWTIDSKLKPGRYRLLAEWSDRQGHPLEIRSKSFRLRAERPEAEPEADLVAQRLIRPAKLPVGKPLKFKAVLTNRGASAESFLVRLRVDGKTVLEQTVDAMSPGHLKIFPFEYHPEKGGVHTFEWTVDPDRKIQDLDRDNNLLVRRWLFEDDNKPVVGQLKPKKFAINYISYEDFQKLQTRRKHRYDQAAVQKTEQPTPAPLRDAVQRSGPPRTPGTLAAQPPKKQVLPGHSAKTAPPFATQNAQVARAQKQGEPAPPGTLLNPDTPQAHRLSAKNDPRKQTVDAPPVAATSADRLKIQTKPLNENAKAQVPTAINDQAAAKAKLESPKIAPDPNANPAQRAKRMENELKIPQLASLPLKPDASRDPSSPNKNQPDAKDLKTDPKTQRDPTKHPKQKTLLSPKNSPEVPTKPGGQKRATSAPKERRESPPVTWIVAKSVKPGAVIAQKGLRINTAKIHFTITTRFTTSPANPQVELIFNAKGRVVRARVLRSSGYPTVDGPVLNSLYKWTAEGQALSKAETTRVTITIELR